MDSQISSFGSLLHSRKGCKYAKIPLISKLRLFKSVVEDGLPIKHISEKLQIKYSTAKTLVRQFKDQQVDIDLTVLQKETNVAQKKKPSCLRAGFAEFFPIGPQNSTHDEQPSQMNLSALISHRETAECHGIFAVKPLNRIEIVSMTLSKQ